MAARYISRRYGDTSEKRLRASSVVKDFSRVNLQVQLKTPKSKFNLFWFFRFMITYHFTPREFHLPDLAASPPQKRESGLLDHLTTITKTTTEEKQSLLTKESHSSVTLYPLFLLHQPQPTCTMLAILIAKRSSSRPWCRTSGEVSRWRIQGSAMIWRLRWPSNLCWISL